jgi:hypothetical protein
MANTTPQTICRDLAFHEQADESDDDDDSDLEWILESPSSSCSLDEEVDATQNPYGELRELDTPIPLENYLKNWYVEEPKFASDVLEKIRQYKVVRYCEANSFCFSAKKANYEETKYFAKFAESSK